MKSVLTYIFGENQEILREPSIIEPNMEYICVTDLPNLKSHVWKIIIDPLSKYSSNRLKIGYVKTHPFKYVSPSSNAVCILDGSMTIERPISDLINNCKNGIMMKLHPTRCRLIDELYAWQTQRHLSPICVERYKKMASTLHANLQCGPLYESCVMIWANTEYNKIYGHAVFDAMLTLSDDKHVFLSNQLVMGLLLQTVFRNIPVTTLNQANYFIKYRHNCNRVHQPFNEHAVNDNASYSCDKIIDNITFLTATFNTPLLPLYVMKSLFKQIHRPIPMCIIDNSTSDPMPEMEPNKWLKIINNTNYRLTPNYWQCSANHAASIEYAMNTIKTKYVMLCDTDILFYPTILELLNIPINEYDACGEIGWSTHPGNRLYPYFCIVNLDKKRRDGVSYFDQQRIMTDCLGNPFNKEHKPRSKEVAYFDTGASFLSDIQFHQWNIKAIHLDDYIIHKKGGTLHPCKDNISIDEWLYENRDLYED